MTTHEVHHKIFDCHKTILAKAKKQYKFHVSRHYLGFCPDPKHFIVQNIVEYGEKWGGGGENMAKNPMYI